MPPPAVPYNLPLQADTGRQRSWLWWGFGATFSRLTPCALSPVRLSGPLLGARPLRSRLAVSCEPRAESSSRWRLWPAATSAAPSGCPSEPPAPIRLCRSGRLEGRGGTRGASAVGVRPLSRPRANRRGRPLTRRCKPTLGVSVLNFGRGVGASVASVHRRALSPGRLSVHLLYGIHSPLSRESA